MARPQSLDRSPPPEGDTSTLPAVSESFLAWTISGEVDFQEREYERPWITHRIRKGSFFLTTGGAPYDVRWKAVTAEPFQAMFVFVELPVLQRAMEEVFGPEAEKARLRDLSAFTDDALSSLMERLREELMRIEASQLFVSSIAQAIAVHIARNYAEKVDESRRGTPSLPAYKLKRVTELMAQHIAEDLSLDQLAAQVGLSKFHFDRLFKRATGLSPSRYQIDLCLIQRPERLIYLSSGMHMQGHFRSESFKGQVGRISYSDSKLHVLMLTKAVARRWTDVYSNAVDPGWVPTKMGGKGAPDDLQEGYETQVWLSTSNDAEARVSGNYFHHQKVTHHNPEADDVRLQEKFLSLCEEVTGVSFP